LVAAAHLAQAKEPPTPPWRVDPHNTGTITVPADIRQVVNMELDLDYRKSDAIKGVAGDLNGDGITDYLLQSAQSLCGTGGCVYVLYDGATRRKIGEFFGNPLIVRAERVHGYVNIATYSHSNAGSGVYTEYSFDGRAYVVTSGQRVEGAAVDRLFETQLGVPFWPPQRSRP